MNGPPVTGAEVVVLDAFADLDAVAAAIRQRAGREVAVHAAQAVPVGPGVRAVLAGPETPLTAADLTALPDLQIIAVTSSGADHVPVGAAARAGIWVTTAAGYCSEEVAESALAMGLDLLRGITLLDRSVRRGEWDVRSVRPRRVAGARWGLVGCGRIAQALARRLVALNVEVRGWDPSCMPAGMAAAATLDELLAGSDIVSLHLPLTDASRGLIGARELALLPDGACLVNVARGELLDTAALAAALADGRLAGASLDVLPVEPPPIGDPVFTQPGTVLTPHAAWYSGQAARLAFQWAAEAVGDVLAGRRPERVIAVPAVVAR